MVTPITMEDKPHEDDVTGEYLDIARTPKSDYLKRVRVRRLICRVCRLKFRTRLTKRISSVNTEYYNLMGNRVIEIHR